MPNVKNIDTGYFPSEGDTMTTLQKDQQSALLNRLYDMKQKQLLQASQQADSLRYRVLSAEADAISEALKAIR